MTGLPRNQVLLGDAAEQLTQLPDSSVDCVVTSPPYFGLRDYGIAGQLGGEGSVDGWVSGLQAVLAEVGRVLKPTGTLWLNLGDSYSRHNRDGAAPKSLLLAPERLLVALAADGWIVRNKLVWAKANSRPSSVADRLTPSWEPLYLLVRSRRYFFDLDAIRSPHRSVQRPRRATPGRARPAWLGRLGCTQAGLDRLKASGLPGHPLGKNPGDVWTLASSNYRGGHFATFPESLVERPLLAGCPRWTCRACGLPWQRQPVDRQLGRLAVLGRLEPSCRCLGGRQPGLVLDPFFGAGTVGLVAERLGRDWLGVELNPAFVALAERRLADARAKAGIRFNQYRARGNEPA